MVPDASLLSTQHIKIDLLASLFSKNLYPKIDSDSIME